MPTPPTIKPERPTSTKKVSSLSTNSFIPGAALRASFQRIPVFSNFSDAFSESKSKSAVSFRFRRYLVEKSVPGERRPEPSRSSL